MNNITNPENTASVQTSVALNTLIALTSLVVNGHTITPIIGDTSFHKFSVETKRHGPVKFTTLKDARRWARLNRP